MDLKSFKKDLLKTIKKQLRAPGFEGKKHEEGIQFIKNLPNGFVQSIIFIDEEDTHFHLSVDFAVRNDEVEKIYEKYVVSDATKRERQQWTTFAVGMEYFLEKEDAIFEIDKKGRADLVTFSQQYATVCQEKAFPFLRNLTDVNELDKLYNDQHDSEPIQMKVVWNRNFISLILAYLTGRTNISKLIQKYTQEFEAPDNPEMTKDYYPEKWNQLIEQLSSKAKKLVE